MCRVDDRMSGMCQKSLNRCDSQALLRKSVRLRLLPLCSSVAMMSIFILALRVIGVYASEVLRIGSRNKKNFS